MDRLMDLRTRAASPKVKKRALSTRDNRVLNYMAVYSTVGDLIDIIDELKDKERIIGELEKELGYQKGESGRTARLKEELGRAKIELGRAKKVYGQRGVALELGQREQDLGQREQNLGQREQNPGQQNIDSRNEKVTPDQSNAECGIQKMDSDIKEKSQKSPQHKPPLPKASPVLGARKAAFKPINKSPKKLAAGAVSPKLKRNIDSKVRQDSAEKTNTRTNERTEEPKPSSSRLNQPATGSTKELRDSQLPKPTSPRLSPRKPHANQESERTPNRTSEESASSSSRLTQQNVVRQEPQDSQLPKPTSPRSSPKTTRRKVHPGVVDPRHRRKKWTPTASYSETLEAVQESGGSDEALSPRASQSASAASDSDIWTTAEADERFKLLMKEHLDLEKAFTALQCDLPLDPLTMVQERYQLEQDLLSAHSRIMYLEQHMHAHASLEGEGSIRRDKFQLIGRNRHLQSKVSDLEEKLMSLEDALSESHEEIEDWEFRVLELEQELATPARIKPDINEEMLVKTAEVEASTEKVEPTPTEGNTAGDLNYVDKWSHVSSELKSQGINVRDVMKDLDELRNNAACASSDQEKIALLDAHKIMDILDKYSHKHYEPQRVEIVPSFTVIAVKDEDRKNSKSQMGYL